MEVRAVNGVEMWSSGRVSWLKELSQGGDANTSGFTSHIQRRTMILFPTPESFYHDIYIDIAALDI